MGSTRADSIGLEDAAGVEVATDAANTATGGVPSPTTTKRKRPARNKAGSTGADLNGLENGAVAPKRKRRPSDAAVAEVAAAAGDPLVAVAAKRKRKAPAKVAQPQSVPVVPDTAAVAAEAIAADHPIAPEHAILPEAGKRDDPADFADLVDSLRGRARSNESAERQVALPGEALELFERCVNDYNRESHKVATRRHRIGTLVYPASPEQESAINEFFSRALGLRIVDIDTRLLNDLPDDEVEASLATLTEPTAHIVALRGMGLDSHPRVFAAIESADVDVLVLGFADPGAKLSPGVLRCLRYRIDLQPAQPIEFVSGLVDTIPRRDAGPNEGDTAQSAAKSPGMWRGFTDRFLRFFRSGVRSAPR